MKLADWNRKLIRPILIIALLGALLGTFTACEELGYPPTTPEEKPEAEPAQVTSPTTISTKDTAMLAVYQQLLGQAKSYDAKIYLSV